MESYLDRLHARARANPALQRLAIISRILLALAFVPTGLVKLLGERFTIMGTESPIGLFFEGMYQSGAYWIFIGAAQVIVGTMLLIPHTVTLGAVLYFPIILNIFVITVALGFQGTPIITGGMLLASIFLLCWDYDRLKAVLWEPAARPRWKAAPMGNLERAGYALGTLAGFGLFAWTRGFVPRSVANLSLVLGLAAVLMVLTAWVLSMRRHRTSASGRSGVVGLF